MSTTEYIPTIQEIGAGAVISKNLSTVNAILRELHTDMTEIPVLTLFGEIRLTTFCNEGRPLGWAWGTAYQKIFEQTLI